MSSDLAKLEHLAGSLPDNWRHCSVGDLFALNTPGHWGGEPEGDGNILVLRSTNFRKAGGLVYQTAAPRQFDDRKLVQKRLERGDIILERSGGSPAQPVGRARRFDAEGCYSASNFMQIMRAADDVDDWFACYLLDYIYDQGLTEPLQKATTGIRNLDFKTYLDLPVSVPRLDEQKRIAEVLRSVDEAIAANQSALEQSEAALSAMSDELFGASLSDESSAWPKHPLEEMLDVIIDYRGVPPPKADSGIPLLTAKNVRFGYLDYEPREFIAAKHYDSWMRRGLPSAGDIMFTTEAPLGNVAEFPDIKAALGQRTLTLVPKAKVLNAKFLKWLLLSKPAQNLIWSHATGSTAKGIKQRTFRKLKFGFPALDEQVRIAQLLEDIGAARDAAKQTGEAYAAMKAHLMSNLLSGRVRVPA